MSASYKNQLVCQNMESCTFLMKAVPAPSPSGRQSCMVQLMVEFAVSKKHYPQFLLVQKVLFLTPLSSLYLMLMMFDFSWWHDPLKYALQEQEYWLSVRSIISSR